MNLRWARDTAIAAPNCTMSLSAYELERLETIRQNQAKLVEMGLEKAAHEVRKISEQKKAVVATEKKERHKRMPAPPTRVSKRPAELWRGIEPGHTYVEFVCMTLC